MKPTYQKVGYIPELRCYLLRNETTGTLELWMTCQGIVTQESLEIGGLELAFIRAIPHAWRIVDSAYNRAWAPEDIGRIVVDEPAAYAELLEL